MNFLDVEVVSASGGKAVVRNAALDPVEVPVRVGRAEAGQRARPDPGKLHGSVELTKRLGSEIVLEVKLRDGTPLIAALTRDAVDPFGTPLNLGFDPAMTHLFAG